MRRYYTYIMMLAMSLLHTGCTIDNEHPKRPERVARIIWYATLDDLTYINSIFRDVAHLHYMLQSNDVDNEAYIEANFPDCTVEMGNGVYDIRRKTNYDTFITTTVDTTSGYCWEVSCNSGNRFHLILQPSGDGFEATFDRLYCGASRGEATLRVNYRMEDDASDYYESLEAIVEYSGTITMVDDESSKSKPITLTTEIAKSIPVVYRELYGMVRGKMKITCEDKLYNTIDVVDAALYGFPDPSRVELSYCGVKETIYSE